MECAWQCFPPSPLKVVKLFISGAEMGDGSLRAGAAQPDHLCFNYWEVQKASAEQEGRAIAFLLSLTCLFSSPCPGSVSFPCPSAVSKGMQRYDGFESHIPNPAPLLRAPAAQQSTEIIHRTQPGLVLDSGEQLSPTQALSRLSCG